MDKLTTQNSTLEYWERVKEEYSDIDDYYRVFAALGARHCTSEGNGWYLDAALNVLVRWFEAEVGQERLEAKTVGKGVKERKLEFCKWLRLVFRGGDADIAESYDRTSKATR